MRTAVYAPVFEKRFYIRKRMLSRSRGMKKRAHIRVCAFAQASSHIRVRFAQVSSLAHSSLPDMRKADGSLVVAQYIQQCILYIEVHRP